MYRERVRIISRCNFPMFGYVYPVAEQEQVLHSVIAVYRELAQHATCMKQLYLPRSQLIQQVVRQCKCNANPPITKTTVGRVVQILYRGSCFLVCPLQRVFCFLHMSCTESPSPSHALLPFYVPFTEGLLCSLHSHFTCFPFLASPLYLCRGSSFLV